MTDWLLPVLGGVVRRGPWRVPERTVLLSLLGGVDLDLTEAELPPGGATFTRIGLLGGVTIQTSPRVRVETPVVLGLGGRREEAGAPADPEAPVFRLRSFCLLGGLSVRSTGGGRPGPPDPPRDRAGPGRGRRRAGSGILAG